MAPLPPAAGVAKVTQIFLCSGRNFGDSFYVSRPGSGPWTVPDLNDLASQASTWWSTHLAALTSDSCSLVRVNALDLSDGVGRLGMDETTHPGLVSDSPPLPLNACARITFQIPRRYRGGHPGYNVSGRVQSQLADERLFNVADADALLNAFNLMMSSILEGTGSGAFQVAVSYFVAGALRLVPLVLPVIGAEIQERLCTLRKRLGKGVAELFG